MTVANAPLKRRFWAPSARASRPRKGRADMEVPSESFKGELGSQEPVIHGEPQIQTVNRWLAKETVLEDVILKALHDVADKEGQDGALPLKTCRR